MAGTAQQRAMMPERGTMVMDVLEGRPVDGIPIGMINPMEWRMIDRLAGAPEGSYHRDPASTYRTMLENSGVCMLDQWIPNNPLSMGSHGYESGTHRGTTTGAEEIIVDGMPINSPESVVEHMERFALPRWKERVAQFDEEATVGQLLDQESKTQEHVGGIILKTPYSFPFPGFDYGTYGYANYFMAYAIYPEIIESVFAACADFSVLHNTAAARAFREGALPPYARLDHDMADTRGTLVSIKSLERIWFPHFARSIAPLLRAGVRTIWHCDGNLMEMVPRLLEVGLAGFQGFEYRHGMDYERICRMRTRDGEPLLIAAGVCVTDTLPYGTPQDVKNEMQWLVRYGPPHNLFLQCSSSITPGVPWKNLNALVEGFNYYRLQHRR